MKSSQFKTVVFFTVAFALAQASAQTTQPQYPVQGRPAPPPSPPPVEIKKANNGAGVLQAIGGLFDVGGSGSEPGFGGPNRGLSPSDTASFKPGSSVECKAVGKDGLAELEAKYEACTKKSAAGDGRPKLLVNLDKGYGYFYDANGNVRCFRITIAKTGIGGGPDDTEPGMFYARKHEGEKYNANYSSYEEKGLNLGIGGKILHSDHEYGAGTSDNKKTLGCIGIEKAMWKEIYDTLYANQPAPILAYSSRMNGCGSKMQGPYRPEDRRSVPDSSAPAAN